MNPRIEISIVDHDGNWSELLDWLGNPYEIYINDDRVDLDQLNAFEEENKTLKALCTNMFEEFVKNSNDIDAIQEYGDRLDEIGIEVKY